MSNAEWDAVMDVARTDWPTVRKAAEDKIVADMECMGDHSSGISSSDINHTIYGAGNWLHRSGQEITVEALVKELSEVG